MKNFGSNSVGDINSFKLTCNRCGKEAYLVPITYIMDNGKVKVKIELRCNNGCKNKFSSYIYWNL